MSVKLNSTNQLNKKQALAQCPVTYTISKIGGRWKPIILFNLTGGTRRYGELKKSIPSITEKMLIQHLRELEADKLIIRKAKPIVPPHVEYSLSKAGEGLKPALKAMAEWGLKNRG